MNTLNKYLLSDNEIIKQVDEIGLVIIDNYGRILIENRKSYIDIPRIVVSVGQNKNEIINKKYNGIFDSDSPYFYQLYELINYRYDNISSEKVKIFYNYVITHDLPKNDKYRFLTLNHIDSLLDSLNYDKYLEYVKDELKILLSKLKDIYKDSVTLLEFSKENYLEQLTDSFLTGNKENELKQKYPFIEISLIIKYTLNFIRNIKNFSIDIQRNELLFQLEKIYPIKSFSNDEWYSDILVKLSKDNKEYWISTYLINSYFNNDIKIYLDENEYSIGDLGEVKGLPQLIMYSKDLKMMSKIDDFEKIKKLNHRNNYFKRY